MADYEKHTPTTDALDTLGSIISEKEKRDAIHLAVYPVKAGCTLNPGDHVILQDDVAVLAAINKGVGIVDPFLDTYVVQGEWFWLVIYPRQIHSLRHVWEHPAFPASGETTQIPEVGIATILDNADHLHQKIISKEWLHAFVAVNDLPSFDLVVAAATGEPAPYNEDYDAPLWVVDDDYITFYGVDAHCPVDAEFWRHMAIYTGKTVQDQVTYFSCTC